MPTLQKIKKPNFTPEFYPWEYYSDAASTIKLNTRAAFKVLDFQAKNKALNAAIVFLKSHFNSNKSFSTYQFKDIPIDFIPKVLQRYVIKKVRRDKNNKKIKSPVMELGGSNEAVEGNPKGTPARPLLFFGEGQQLKIAAVPTPVRIFRIFNVDSVLRDL